MIALGMSFNERGAPGYNMITVQWQDGELEVVLPLKAQTALPAKYADYH